MTTYNPTMETEKLTENEMVAQEYAGRIWDNSRVIDRTSTFVEARISLGFRAYHFTDQERKARKEMGIGAFLQQVEWHWYFLQTGE